MDYEDYYENHSDYSNSTQTRETEHYSSLVLRVAQGLATVIGLPANVLLLVLFATTPRLLTVSNMLLLQRAIADVLMFLPYIIHVITGMVSIGEALCTSIGIFVHVSAVASQFLLMAYTLDSYQAAYPQHHTLLFRRKTMTLTSVASWVLAVTAGVAAYFYTSNMEEYCIIGPLFSGMLTITSTVLQVSLLLILPLVVVWVFVSVALPPRPYVTIAEPRAVGEGGPNRRLLLGLASTFTILNGFYWLVSLVLYVSFSDVMFVISIFSYSLMMFSETLNAILVICLSEELRQKVAAWLPSRQSASVPLQDM